MATPKVAARRAGRLGDGFWPGKGTKESLAELIAIGRARPWSTAATPTPSRSPPPATAPSVGARSTRCKALADLGVSRVILPPLAFDPEGQRQAFGKYGEDVISKC